MSKLVDLDNNVKSYIINEYENGRSSSSLAREFSVAPNNMTSFIRKLGVSIRRYHSYHHKTFSKWPINTEYGDYWLGFLLADGHINKNKIVVELSYKDYDHLKKFGAYVCESIPIIISNNRISPNSKTSKIEICSKSICKSLISIGWNNFKYDGNPKIFKEIKSHRHLMRGFFDGDGSIGPREFNISSPHYNILHSINKILKEIGCSIKVYCDKRSARFRKTKHGNDLKDLFRIRTTDKSKILSIYNWFYDSSSIYMSRKKFNFERNLHGHIR